MYAPKLSQLIKANVRQLTGNLEIICSLGCGNVIKDYVHVSVIGVNVTAEPLSRIEGEKEKLPALDLRICPQCWGVYVYDQQEVHREIALKASKHG